MKKILFRFSQFDDSLLEFFNGIFAFFEMMFDTKQRSLVWLCIVFLISQSIILSVVYHDRNIVIFLYVLAVPIDAIIRILRPSIARKKMTYNKYRRGIYFLALTFTWFLWIASTAGLVVYRPEERYIQQTVLPALSFFFLFFFCFLYFFENLSVEK